MELAALQNARPEHENEQERQVLALGGPGIMVLDLPLRILYMNQRASDLIVHFPLENHANGHPRGAKGVLPAPFLEANAAIGVASVNKHANGTPDLHAKGTSL